MNENEIDHFIPRRVVIRINNLLKSKGNDVILVKGPRQVGKTTAVKQALLTQPHVAVNLEKQKALRSSLDRCHDFTEFEQWLEDALNFKPGSGQILFVDEAQESRILGSFVRSMKEDWENTKVILTGSMMSRLFRKGVRYPVGRISTLSIQGFSYFEFLKATGKEYWLEALEKLAFDAIGPSRHERLLKSLNTYLHVGGLPRAVIQFVKNKDYRAIISEIYADYQEDFIRVFGEDQSFLFERAMQAVADHVGSPSQYSQAIEPKDKHYRQISNVYSQLEGWEIFYNSLQRSIYPEGSTLYHPKRYFFDLGMLNYLRTLGIPDLELLKTKQPVHRTALGGIIENFVALYLKQWGIRLAGWKRSASGMEIDFIAKFNDRIIPIECKASLRLKENHLRGLKIYMKEYGLPIGVIINGAPFEKRTYDFGYIYSVPFYAVEVFPKIINL